VLGQGLTTFFSLDVQTDLRKQFQEIARRHSPEPRQVYIFMTTAIVRNILLILILLCVFFPFFGGIFCAFTDTLVLFSCLLAGARHPSIAIAQDTRAMTAILSVVRVSIISDNLQNAELIQ